MTPLSMLLVLVSALTHSSWNFFAKRANWPLEFFFLVFLVGALFYVPFLAGFGIFPSMMIQSSPVIWGAVISSAFVQTFYFICLIGAYRIGDLSLVYPISRSAPLFTQIWAVYFIGEVLSNWGMLGIGLVTAGLFTLSLQNFRFHMISHSKQFFSRPYLLALIAAITGSIYSVIDKVGVQLFHPFLYGFLINLWMCFFTGLYLFFRREGSFLKIWSESKRDIFIIAALQGVGYLFILLALQLSKVSYVVAFRQVSALFGAILGIVFLKESHWKPRIVGVLILTLGLVLIGFAK